jgi:FKBP-type peptidyl-prolyl cis-trans isomerase
VTGILITTVAFSQTTAKKPAAPTATNLAWPMKMSGPPTTTPSGLQYWEIKVGAGAKAIPGETVRVHYIGWLTNGKKFDASLDRPFSFDLGTGHVIKGWDEGVEGMRVGGKRQLRIPPDLAYGAGGTPGGPIPPNATLIFDVELVGIQ